MPNVLVIDDNPEILEANKSHLASEGYCVTTADTGINAIMCIKEDDYDCIIMDIMLPDIDGYALCKAARNITNAPIILLTCLDSPDDKVKGLMSGGDDYLTKPYSLKELTARVHAHLRREQRNVRHVNLPVGEVFIDKKKKIVQTQEKGVLLTKKEFDLFILLFENPGKMFPKEELLQILWKDNSDINAVAMYIMKLRRKLHFARRHIGTIENDYRRGYYISRPEP